jgi:hypothetical protein
LLIAASGCAQVPEPAESALTAPSSPGARAVPAAGEVMGMDMPSLKNALGLPSVTRRERPAQIWQYRAGGCVLDVFFYEDSGIERVVHLEARDRQARPVALEACLPEVAALDRGRG